MRHTHDGSLNPRIYHHLFVAALTVSACSGADLSSSSSTGQGSIPLESTTGGTSSAGTSPGSTGGSATGSTSNAGTAGKPTGTGGTSSKSAPTWSQLYTNYFASACVSCHGSGTSPSFNSASTMCSALKSSGFIRTGSATLQNLLTWFGGTGSMPVGGGAAPANAVTDITAWQNSGAACP